MCKMQFSPDKEVSKSKKKFLLNFWNLFFFWRSSSISELVLQMWRSRVLNSDLVCSVYNIFIFFIFSSNDIFLFLEDLFDGIFSLLELLGFVLLVLLFFGFEVASSFSFSFSFSFCSPLFKSSFIKSISFWYSGFNLNKYILLLFFSLSFSFTESSLSFSISSLTFSLSWFSFSFSFSSFFCSFSSLSLFFSFSTI